MQFISWEIFVINLTNKQEGLIVSKAKYFLKFEPNDWKKINQVK